VKFDRMNAIAHRLQFGVVAGAVAVTVLMTTSLVDTASPAAAVPQFEVDTTWPQVPNNWVVGQLPSVSVDKHDQVWILHRPRLLPEELRKRAAPPVLEFDANGKFVNAWGGPGTGYDWPGFEHGIYVDLKDNVWVGGSGPQVTAPGTPSDDFMLKFDHNGRFLLEIGRPASSGGNHDTKNFNKAADIFVYAKTNEAFIADGYGNRRLIVVDADTGAFKRMWGAFGNPPEDPKPAPWLTAVRNAGTLGQGVE
jgi:hypothetical protein